MYVIRRYECFVVVVAVGVIAVAVVVAVEQMSMFVWTKIWGDEVGSGVGGWI